MASVQNRDIVVIGASAGGLEATSELLASLPTDLPATLFVAQHMSPSHASMYPELRMRRTRWRALYPVHGQETAQHHVYVAPPDNQLLVRQGYVHVTRGPKENGHRPSVDALFRSAARAYGSRVIGVVLSGHLDCGTAGLLSIKARAGLALVQDPQEAGAPEMPSSAIHHVRVDHVAPVAELARLLADFVREPASTPASAPRSIVELEGDEPGVRAGFVCPSCHGALTESNKGEYWQYRCHVGHVFSSDSLLAEQSEETERALWAAVRSLDESASIAERMATRSSGDMKARFEEKHETLTRQANVIRRILLGPEESPALSGGRERGDEN